MKIEDSGQSDWYKWWFSHGLIKKTIGLILIAAIVVPLVIIGAVTYYVYLISPNQMMQSKLSIFVDKNIAVIIGALTLLMGIVVAILLLPSLQKFKVGAVELQTAPAPATDFKKVLFPPILASEGSVISPRVNSSIIKPEIKLNTNHYSIRYEIILFYCVFIK
jgi:hypothetical protein